MKQVIVLWVLCAVVLLNTLHLCNAKKDGLKMNYYKKTCRSVESISRSVTWSRVSADPTLAAKLLRLHYHDCFVRGCDASVLLDATTQNSAPEKTAGANRNLAGYDVIDQIKSKIEELCPGVVSCADIVALAARDAVSFQFQREMWPVFTGRKDGGISLASEAATNLPSANANFTTLLSLFSDKGLDMNDLVTLSGAHTIGVTHCTVFARRLRNFTANGGPDPTLDQTYVTKLTGLCPLPSNPSTEVEMDPDSSLKFDSQYYQTLNQKKGIFTSDAALLTNPVSARLVRLFENQNVFFQSFARSMVKMGSMDVLSDGDADGQVRLKCRVVNSA